MKFIKGITFAPFYRKNTLNTEQARESFDYMIENTGADFVILAPGGLQDTAHSEEICYSSNATFSDEELADMICYAKKKGVRVGLKPTVNCKMENGEHISAFLNMMYRVSQNGETGFRPTQNFRRIMRRLHKKKNAIC